MKISFRIIALSAASLAVGLIAFAPSASTPRAYAATADAASSAPTSVCDLSTGLQKFFETKGEDLKLELQARKGLLYIVADCSKEETTETIATLEKIDMHDDALNRAKGQLIDQLKMELSYADSQKGRVAEVGLQGTRDLARTLKEWRTTTHAPQASNAANFQLFIKNQDLLNVANDRANQIDQTLKTLKLADRDDIKSAESQARDYLSSAQSAHDQAQATLSRLENPGTTAQLLKSSFDGLSHAYDSFFKVSEAVKKILPL
jgi:hypothetical protein